MSTLYDRLLEICRDQRIENPRGRDIQAVTGLSSGRITQIKQEREAARLGGEALQAITRLGYSADWIQEGHSPKFQGEVPHARSVDLIFRKREDPLIAEVVKLLEATDERGRLMALGAVKSALSGYVPAAKTPAAS